MRATTSIVLFYVWFTAGANLVESVGFIDALGVSTSVSAGERLAQAVSALNDIDGGGISTESLVGVYTLGTGTIEAFLLALTAGPRLLANIGMPIELVVFLHAPIGLLGGRLLFYAFTGRDL